MNNCKMTYTKSLNGQMKVNVEKCAVLRCTRSLSPILHDYTLASHNINIKKLHTYLGVGIDSNMTWSSHIQTISNKSTKVLNFIKRNLYNCPPDTKRTAYLTLVRSIMEYAAPVWDPYYNVDIYKLEKVCNEKIGPGKKSVRPDHVWST